VLEDDIVVTQGELQEESVSPNSTAFRCVGCNSRIYRTSTAFPATAWLQTSCLEDLRCAIIGAHTWVKRKDDWLQLPQDVPHFEEGYDRKDAWPRSSLDRLAKALGNAT